MHTITISVPDNVYQQIRQQSQRNRRDISEEVVAAVVDALPQDDILPVEIEKALAQLDNLAAEDLWAAARLTSPLDKQIRMQTLLDKQEMEGLTFSEQEEALLLGQFFDQVMLVRAKAAALLKARGQNIDSLLNQS